MQEAIRRQALRSAAKVAFGATLVWGAALSGCGGQSVGGASVEDGSEGDVGSSSGGGRDVVSPSGGGSNVGSSSAGGRDAGSSPSAGGRDVGSSSAGGSNVGVPSAGTGAVPPDAGNEPALVCNVSAAGLDAGVLASADRATYACCAEYVATKLPSDPQVAPNVPELTRDPAVVECCRYVNAAYYELLSEPYPYAVNDFCCRPGVLPVAEYSGPFCTPWGPPVPPSLAVARGAVA